MATVNKGITPPDPLTNIGSLRYLIGDIDYEPLTPPETGLGDYGNFSDAELQSFIISGGGSVTRASGYAYLRLAALAASGAISWKSDDLSVDSKQVATEFRLLANIAFDQADNADDSGASAFSLDHPYSTCDCIQGYCVHHAELAAYATCGCGGNCSGYCQNTDDDVYGGTP